MIKLHNILNESLSVWTEFEATRFDIDDKKWYTEKVYYKGDYRNTDLKSDWRFKEVPGKRKELKPTRLVYTTKTPLNFNPKKALVKLPIGFITKFIKIK